MMRGEAELPGLAPTSHHAEQPQTGQEHGVGLRFRNRRRDHVQLAAFNQFAGNTVVRLRIGKEAAVARIFLIGKLDMLIKSRRHPHGQRHVVHSVATGQREPVANFQVFRAP